MYKILQMIFLVLFEWKMSFFSTLKFLNYDILIFFICRFESATPLSTLLIHWRNLVSSFEIYGLRVLHNKLKASLDILIFFIQYSSSQWFVIVSYQKLWLLDFTQILRGCFFEQIIDSICVNIVCINCLLRLYRKYKWTFNFLARSMFVFPIFKNRVVFEYEHNNK